MQSRASRLNDVLTTLDINEIADVEPGTASRTATLERRPGHAKGVDAGVNRNDQPKSDIPTHLSVASIGPGGKVTFKDTDDFKELGGR
jgi:hypothetical protein